MSKKYNVIYCPNCGAEYLPAEIYLPNEFLGKPSHIEKNFEGKIIDFCDNTMNLCETYICDKCDTKFKISARVNFKTEAMPNESFNKDYVTEIPKKITLNEV